MHTVSPPSAQVQPCTSDSVSRLSSVVAFRDPRGSNSPSTWSRSSDGRGRRQNAPWHVALASIRKLPLGPSKTLNLKVYSVVRRSANSEKNSVSPKHIPWSRRSRSILCNCPDFSISAVRSSNRLSLIIAMQPTARSA